MHDLFNRGLISEKRIVNSEQGKEEKIIWKLRPAYKDAPELYKESELGMIPKEWEIRKIKEIGSSNREYTIDYKLE